MTTQWFYSKNNQQLGPISSQQLKELASNGTLSPTDLVWSERLTEWTPASRLKGIVFPSQGAKAPPPLPPAPESHEPMRVKVADGEQLGLNRFLPASFLQSMSKPAVVIGLTFAIAFILIVLPGEKAMGYAVAFASAFLIYYDASANRIGKVLPRRFFSANGSAGAWALVVLFGWLIYFPMYFIKRPMLIEKAKNNPRDPSGRTWKLVVLGVIAASSFLGGLKEIGTNDARVDLGSFSTSEKVSKSKFDQIRKGMSYAQVVKIIGAEGEEISSTGDGGMYAWHNSDGSGMMLGFQNDRLFSKAQLHLK